MILSNSSSLVSSEEGATGDLPALLTRICAPPQRSVTSAYSRPQSSQRPASKACAEARRPAAVSCSRGHTDGNDWRKTDAVMLARAVFEALQDKNALSRHQLHGTNL
jgi:hypothetical protein